MNWKCLLGVHDWETLKSSHHNDVLREVKNELGIIHYGRDLNEVRVYEEKVCLRCKKYVNEIKPAKEFTKAKFIADKSNGLTRQELAKAIKQEIDRKERLVRGWEL